MPKIRSPRSRSEGDVRGGAPSATRRQQSSDLALWYHGNKQWMPLVATVFGGAGLYLLSQVEALRPYMGFTGGLLFIIGGIVYGLMRPEDAPVRVGRNPLMPVIMIAAGAILVAALVPYLHTNFPGVPRYHGTLSPGHPRGQFEVPDDNGLIEVVVHGSLRSSGSSAAGGYEMMIEHGGTKKRVQGAFKRTYSTRKIRRGKVKVASSAEFTYHVSQVPSMGKGRYTLSLVSVDPSLRNYLRVKVFDTWYTEKMLIVALASLVAIGFMIDLAATRLKQRTRLATGAIASVGFAVYFARQFAPDAVMSAVLGGAFVCIVASWIGGGMLSFLAKRIGGEPRFVKAAGRDDED